MRLHFLRNIPSISQVRSRLISRRGAAVLLVSVLVISAWLVRPASAAIAFRAAGIGNNGTGANTVTVSKPTGTVEKDVMVAVVSINQAGSTMLAGAPTGWTLINENVSGTTVYSGTFYKVATASEPASYDFTLLVGMVPTSKKAAGVIVSYSGVDTINPIDAQGSLVNASSATMTAPSVTTTAANAMLVAAYSTATGTTIAAGGSSMNLRGQATSAGGGQAGTKATSAVQDVIQATAGVTGSKTMTAGATAVNIGHLIALTPKPAFSQSSYRFFANADTSGTSESFTKLANPATLPANPGLETDWSASGDFVTFGINATPYFITYKRSGDTFTKLADPAVLSNGGQGVAWSPDDTYLSSTASVTPYISIHKRSGDTFTKLADPASLPPSNSRGVSWSPDGTYLTVASLSAPSITIYKRSGDTFTKLSNPASLPAGSAFDVDWSPDGTYMSVSHDISPFITIYKRSGDTFTKLSDPASLPAGAGNGVSWSPDGTYVSVAHSSSRFVTIYKRSGDTFTKLSDPATLPTGSGLDVGWSSNGNYMTVAHATSPFITIYKRSGDTFTKLSNPATLPTGDGWGAAWGANDRYMTVAHATSPFITIYKYSPPETQVSTPLAAQNTAATSGGAGVPFRLRMNLHVTEGSARPDTAFKLQFAQRSGTCDTSYAGETFSDVGTTSGALRFYDNTTLNDADGVSTDANNPTHATDTVVRQSYEEANSFRVANAISAGQDGLWDFSLVFDSSASYGSYCFRVVNTDGSAIAAPSVVPEISNPAPPVGQANYRFFANADSTTPGAPLAAQDTTATIAAETPFRLRQRLAVGTAQLGQSSQNYKLQYAEKSGVCDVGFSGETYNDIKLAEPSAYASSAVNDASAGGIGWTSVSSASGAPDGVKASLDSPLTPGTNTSQYMMLTGLGFSVPSSATILGIQIVATANSDDPNDSGVTGRLNAFLLKNGAVTGTGAGNKIYSSLQTIDVMGGATDLWGATWTPADVNAANFGISLSAFAAYDEFVGTSTKVFVDAVQVSVYYRLNGAVGYQNNATPVDIATISSSGNDPTNASRPTVYQSYRETDPFTNNVAAIPPGSDGLWDFALMGGSAVAGKTYCMRVVKSDGSLLDSYSQIPEITFSSGGGGGLTLDQQLRGGAGVVNGTKSPLVW